MPVAHTVSGKKSFVVERSALATKFGRGSNTIYFKTCRFLFLCFCEIREGTCCKGNLEEGHVGFT